MGHKHLTLFHTNDIHSDFNQWPGIVRYVKEHRTKDSLFVDLGDHADRSHSITEATDGKANMDLLNMAGVDYATIGNNEGVTFSKEQLGELYQEATFPILLANLMEENGDQPDWSIPSTIRTMENGLKVGLFGLTAPLSHFYEKLGWSVLDLTQCITEQVKLLKPQVDVLVLLSHLGLFKDEKIAQEIRGIDVIIGAHTHHVLEQGERIQDTLIVQAGKHGHYLGEVTLTFDDNNHLQESVAVLHEAKELPSDPETMTYLLEAKKRSDEILKQPMAVLPMPLAVDWYKETTATRLLCDGLTEWCGESIGMLNAGVLLSDLPKGQLTRGEIHQICPHPINPCVIRLTGKELQNTIERASSLELINLELKGFGFRGQVLGKMIYTGVSVEYDAENEELVRSISILGEPLDLEAEYRLATLDMYTFGFLYPELTDAEDKTYLMPEFLRDILAWKLNQL
ncbi:bifunctional metallophosphatase/5'-nucleotidase [Alkalicoccobacillus plakortidis]|uniref:Bifunctional metallophosphatase/5'-nucleotidase n=1 Tax=Alkalicoccobacillus plakortidis TaxID=444060 RepID=A0ABT0XHV4_9BACI|nr:bifunctional UDP-sugar hydrolase/5'-nucleotidase [Alkalicoccobacillus plakortidis]MCM2675482.1 bifunctional metallophosphatase/5'-nucleotidase [Alkalicoccobacillus plakortidis]